ncbi:hypothetical protein [Qipengyuania spongiae]|uniref:Uncharacterized protein n=1 Tax=Qipengyuania spongiae TaxID=2909673 RepID=A0ABY5T331_9SPHN|nr:hypothetical protein [Qipengyuania spongiae]UVI39711.1 hypothetical protein L1F33_01750 [Qipengyuania spongiae]
MNKLALVALPLALGLVACDNAAEEPMETESTEVMTTEPMVTETPMATETPMMEEGMATEEMDTMTETPAPEATETPM